MAETIKVHIPVLPHIKKFFKKTTYLKCKYEITRSDNIGVFITKFLSSPPRNYKPITQNTVYYIGRKSGKKRAEIIEIDLAGYSDRGKSYISSTGIHLFNVWASDVFYRQMYTYIEARLEEKKTRIDVLITDFMDQYGISEDELSVQSLLRWYFREKKKFNNII